MPSNPKISDRPAIEDFFFFYIENVEDTNGPSFLKQKDQEAIKKFKTYLSSFNLAPNDLNILLGIYENHLLIDFIFDDS